MFNIKRDILDFIDKEGISIANLSRESGVLRTRIDKWKAGKGNPGIEDYEKLQTWKREYLGKKRPGGEPPGILLSEPAVEYINSVVPDITLSDILQQSVLNHQAVMAKFQEIQQQLDLLQTPISDIMTAVRVVAQQVGKGKSAKVSKVNIGDKK